MYFASFGHLHSINANPRKYNRKIESPEKKINTNAQKHLLLRELNFPEDVVSPKDFSLRTNVPKIIDFYGYLYNGYKKIKCVNRKFPLPPGLPCGRYLTNTSYADTLYILCL